MQYLNSKVQHKTKQFKRYESLKLTVYEHFLARPTSGPW